MGQYDSWSAAGKRPKWRNYTSQSCPWVHFVWPDPTQHNYQRSLQFCSDVFLYKELILYF